MAGLYNRVKMTTATTGTGTVTLGSAAANNYCTFAEAGVPNAKQVRYVIEEGTDFEIGLGTYTSSGTTLSRDTVTLSKIGGTAGTSKMNLAGAATVRIDAAAEDLNNGSVGVATRPKVVTFTRDISLTANFSITGVGFAPRIILFWAAVAATAGQFAWGVTDGTTSVEISGRGSIQTDGMGQDTTCFDIVVSSGNSNAYSLVSLDSDGFTLSCSKAGSPTGTVSVNALCFP